MGVWSKSGAHEAPNFMVLKGIAEVDSMLRGLGELGFEETSYNGTTYYRINEDFRLNFRHPVRILKRSWNRVALDGQPDPCSPGHIYT